MVTVTQMREKWPGWQAGDAWLGCAMGERHSVGPGWEGEEGEPSPCLGMGRCAALPREQGMDRLCWRAADDGDAVLGVSYRHMTDGNNI